MRLNIDDLRIQGLANLIAPHELIASIPQTESGARLVTRARENIADIMHGRSDRLLVVVGPCSIHDPKAALEYAQKLKAYADRVSEDLMIVMRVYFEKPRTTVGWKGLINDPHLDNSFDINAGLKTARQLLADVTQVGLPIATEFLDTITPQFISDFIAWGAIGARTTESQVHRELASGLSMPIGFKNGTDGNVQIAVDAVLAASHPHHFLSVTKAAHAAIVKTLGNTDGHVILRGGNAGTNYDADSINKTVTALKRAHLSPYVMVDCSHGNSRKDYKQQVEVVKSLAAQITDGSEAVFGVMIESHLKEGKQALVTGKALTYGQSITDGCLGIEETFTALDHLARAVRVRRGLKLKNRNDDEMLSDIRAQIDAIDQEIQSLVLKRAEASKEVGRIKRKHNPNAEVYRPEREAQILNMLKERNQGRLPEAELLALYQHIFKICRNMQET
jgi:3-deoxy-7-phosphoheptulonate synthase